MIKIDLHKKLDGSSGPILLNLQLEIERGTFLSIYGPSGAGKTSILKMLAGLMKPDKGEVFLDPIMWYNSDALVDLPPQKRNVGIVFQDYTLFPNMTVIENLKYALRKIDDSSIINELVEIMDIGNLKDAHPNRLSGGQKQRVALARALVQKPQLLLLDEPLSALDQDMRSKLQDYIMQAHKTYGLTTIVVSHDVAEIFKMCDEAIILEEGKVLKRGKPIDVFSKSTESGKFQFTGEVVTMVEQDFMLIISILIGNDIVKVISSRDEIEALKIGDRVLVASKAFNPIIKIL